MTNFRKKYNTVLCFAIIVIMLAIVCLSVNPAPKTAIEAQEEAVAEVEEEIIQIQKPTVAKEKVKFSTYRSAFDYVVRSLNSTPGYKSRLVGMMNGSMGIEFRQDVIASKIVDNINGEAFFKATTNKKQSLGADLGIQLFTNKESGYRNSLYWNGESFYPTEEILQSTIAEYFESGLMSPKDLAFSCKNVAIKNGSITNTGSAYNLDFVVDGKQCITPLLNFIKICFNCWQLDSLYPTISDTNFRIVVDHYGVVKKMSVQTTFTCELSPIGLPGTIYGYIASSEIFYDYGIANTIDCFANQAAQA